MFEVGDVRFKWARVAQSGKEWSKNAGLSRICAVFFIIAAARHVGRVEMQCALMKCASNAQYRGF